MTCKGLMTITVLAMSVGMCATANGIVNPSFEDDGDIFSVAFFGAPTGWTESLPGNYDAKVSTDWSTNGIYSLSIFAKARTYYSFSQAAMSQDVNFTDHNNLVFDFKAIAIKTADTNDWDNTKFRAFVDINGVTVWESPNDVNVIENQIIDVSGYSGIANLSLGIKVLSLYEAFEYSYNTIWDNIRLTNDTVFLPCGGNGYLDTDLNYDCYVDFNDMKIILDNWLNDDFDGMPPYGQLINIDGSGLVNFMDYSMVADDMGLTTDATNLDAVAGDFAPLSLDVAYDANDMTDGTVNFADYARIVSETVDYQTLMNLAEQWLQIAPPNKK